MKATMTAKEINVNDTVSFSSLGTRVIVKSVKKGSRRIEVTAFYAGFERVFTLKPYEIVLLMEVK